MTGWEYYLCCCEFGRSISNIRKLSKEELIGIVSENHFTITKLQRELDQLKKLVFGSRHERFQSATPAKDQLPLGLNLPAVEVSEVAAVQKIEYTRTTPLRGRSRQVDA